jgi:hypothetical protein
MDDFERLAMQIHEAAIEPRGFPDLARRISDFIGAGSIHMLVFDPDTGTEHLSLFERGDPAFAEEYLRDYITLDFRVPRVLSQKRGALVEEASYVAREEARGSEIHQSLLPKYAIHNIAGSNLGVGETIGWCGLSTTKADREFDGRQLRLGGGLMAHMHVAYRALIANAQARRERAAMAAALDTVNAAVFMFEGTEPSFINSAGNALLDEGFFRLLPGRLGCRAADESRRIAALFSRPPGSQASLIVRDLAAGAVHHMRVTTPLLEVGAPAKAREWIVAVTPLSGCEAPSRETVEDFAAGFGLTPRETAAIGAALAFVSLRQFADDNGIALDTAQKHLKSAMVRMGLRSQKALFQAFERYRVMGG